MPVNRDVDPMITGEWDEARAAGSSAPACSVSLRYENLRLRSALRDMLREAESDLRNNDGNPYRAVVLRAQAALNISTPNIPLCVKSDNQNKG